jgi:hypothetical protein
VKEEAFGGVDGKMVSTWIGPRFEDHAHQVMKNPKSN